MDRVKKGTAGAAGACPRDNTEGRGLTLKALVLERTQGGEG